MTQTENAAPHPGQPPVAKARFPVAVSVLMPAHGACDTLERAVASVRAQSFEDWELLITDDACAGGTGALAAALAGQDPRIRVLAHTETRGAAAARNTALAAARGRYIAFLDADDAWCPEKLARQIPFMERTGAALGYTGFWRVAEGGARRAVPVPATVTRAALLRGNVIGCLTAVYDRAALGDCPMPALPLRQDYALWLDILGRVPCAHGLTEPLALNHTRPGSLSSNRLRAAAATWAMYRRHMGLPRHRAAWYLGNHLLRRLARG